MTAGEEHLAKIVEFAKLDVKPGQALVMKVSEDAFTYEVARELGEMLAAELHHAGVDVPIFVVSAGETFEVLQLDKGLLENLADQLAPLLSERLAVRELPGLPRGSLRVIEPHGQ